LWNIQEFEIIKITVFSIFFKGVKMVDRLFGALIISLALLTSALVSVILSEEGFIFSVVCIGLATFIGIILLTNRDEKTRRTISNEEIEKELEEELTKG
jgi:nitrate reductase gamma subunit